MTALERTAYPRFRPSIKELAEVYTPTPEDLAFVRGIARGPAPTLTAMVLLKSFERRAYMPRLQDVPFAIIGHIRSALRLPSDTAGPRPGGLASEDTGFAVILVQGSGLGTLRAKRRLLRLEESSARPRQDDRVLFAARRQGGVLRWRQA